MKEQDSIQIKKRKLTPFQFQQFSYEYITQKLDKNRRLAVEEFVEDNPDYKESLLALGQSIEYCDELSKTKVSENLIAYIESNEPLFSRLKNKLEDQLPSNALKWLAQAFAISFVVAVVVMLLPWQRIVGPSLRSIPKKLVTTSLEPEDVVESAVEEAEVVAPGSAEHVTSTVAIAEKEEPVKNSSKKEDTLKQIAKNEEEKATSGLSVKTNAKKNTVLPGTLHRYYMKLTNTDDVAPSIVQKIQSLGGKKAGEVELGWKKPGGRYFHFSLPDENDQELQTFLRTFGEVQTIKNNHWREMPPGKRRIILWIQAIKPPKTQETSETQHQEAAKTPVEVEIKPKEQSSDSLQNSEQMTEPEKPVK